jgi:hypothetical protein
MSGLDADKNHIFEELKKLGKPYIIEWLDEVKHYRKHTDKKEKYGYVFNPFDDVDEELELEVYPATGKYAIILEWCKKNIPDYDYEGIPLPYGYGLPASSVRLASSASAAKSDKPIKVDVAIILKWLEDPSRDEKGDPIEVALYEDSKYYKLYSNSFKYLHELHNPVKTPLTKKLYKKIQGSLPKTHIYEFDIKDSDTGAGSGAIYTYDHLMMKCISENNIKLNDEVVDYKFFMTEYDIFEEIYIGIEKVLKNPKFNKNVTKRLILSFTDVYGLYYSYGERLFEYVVSIMQFNKSHLYQRGMSLEGTYKNIEKDKIKIKLYNFISSSHPAHMYTPETIVEKYKGYRQGRAVDGEAMREEVFARTNNENIVNFIKTAIYDISDLYEEAKVNVGEYLPISEDQSIKAPLYPSPPMMNNDVTRYKMLMTQIKLLKSNIQESNGKMKEDFQSELEEYNKRIVVYDTPTFKAVLKEYEQMLKNYKIDVKQYEQRLKIYKTVVKIYERDIKDVLGKQGKHSDSPTRVLPFTPIEKRAYKSLSPSKKSTSKSSTMGSAKGSPKKTGIDHLSNCVNDNDPITQEPFEDMSEKTLKYLSKIPTIITTTDNEEKKIITCYNTVSLYNYILTCYYKNAVPVNFGMGRGSLTLEDMNQVKRKIKHFTTNKTLPSVIINKEEKSSDSKKKKVFGKLIEIYIKPISQNHGPNIPGHYAIRLRIKIGGIYFKIFDDKISMVPMLIGDDEREDAGEIPMITMIYDEILKKQKSGNLFVTNYFPYRRGKEYILRVPDYTRMFRNGSEDILIAARNTYYNDLILM